MIFIEAKIKLEDPSLNLKLQNFYERIKFLMWDIRRVSQNNTIFNISTKHSYLRFTIKDLIERIDLEKRSYRTRPISDRKDPIFGFAEKSFIPFVDICKFNKLPKEVIRQAPRRDVVIKALKAIDDVERYNGKSFEYILDDITLEELISIDGIGDVSALEFFKFIRILGHSCE